MQLYDYQRSAVDAALSHEQKKTLIIAPTGAGKTVIAAEIARCFLSQGKTVAAYAHTRVIQQQLRDRMPDAVSVLSLGKREIIENSHDVAIIDEAHHLAAKSYQLALKSAPTVYGLTATPVRLDGQNISALFDEVIQATTYGELLHSGVLMSPVFRAPANNIRQKLTEKDEQFGDYKTSRISGLMRKERALHSVAEAVKKYCAGKRAVIYCCDIAHAKKVKAHLEQICSEVLFISGNMSKKQQQDVLERFKASANAKLVNVAVLTEGYDLPSLDAMICARPTKSATLWQQMVGRTLRKADGKERPQIIDLVGNHTELGIPQCNYYTKSEPTSRSGQKCTPRAELWVCLVCDTVNESINGTCDNCGSKREIRREFDYETSSQKTNIIKHVVCQFCLKLHNTSTVHVCVELSTCNKCGEKFSDKERHKRTCSYYLSIKQIANKCFRFDFRVGYMFKEYCERFGRKPTDEEYDEMFYVYAQLAVVNGKTEYCIMKQYSDVKHVNRRRRNICILENCTSS